MTQFAFQTYTGNGSTTQYSISFTYIDSTHVKCFLDGVSTTAFSVSGSTVTFNSAPANNVVIRIERETPLTARLVDFQDGSVLTEADLDMSANQNFFAVQEFSDDASNYMQLATDDKYDAKSKVIKDVANPVNNNDAVNKTYLENTWLSPTDKATLNSVNTNITAIQTVNSNISAIQTSNSNATNINTVATNIGSVNTVATDIAKVIAVANDLAEAVSEVETVADDLNEATSEIDTVAGAITNVDLVGNNIASVNTLAGVSNLQNLANAHTQIVTVGNNIPAVQSFGNTYKISASAPSSPIQGTLWFDTTANIMKVYDGSSFINAGSSVNGTSGRFKYIATANQTTFTGASHSDTSGAVLTYDAGFINVFKNGVHLDPSDYTATDGNNVVLDVGCSVNDEIYILTFGTFSIASISATAITSDTLGIARGGTGKTTSDLSGQQGKALVVNSAQNGFDLSTTSSAEVYGFENYYTPSTLVKTVTVQSVSGSNKYFIDGVQQDTLELYEGNTYVFNYPSAHPFKFSTTSDGTHNSGSEYTSGVTHNSSTQVTIVVPSNAPTLYYYCGSHSAMGGQANTPVPADNSVRVITTNQGADNISSTQFANFDEKMFSASGFVFSISNGELIATI